MELFKLFFVGACIGVILNVLWVIYYQIPRMMGRIVDLEDKYEGLNKYTWNLHNYTYEKIVSLEDKYMEESDA